MTPGKIDILGAASSSLCLIHCFATPYLFIIQAGIATQHKEAPLLWNMLDILLLVVSLFAVYMASKRTSKKWVKYALFISWIFLAGIILNEKVEGIDLPEGLIYLPSLSLVTLHLYNRKYCYCTRDAYCAVPDQINENCKE